MEENKIRSSEPSNPEYATTDLREYLTEVAEAIRVKTGKDDLIPAQNFVEEILEIETGTDTSDATAAADEIFAGETAYTADGKVTGTFTIDDELTEQNDLIRQISTLVATKANPQGGTEDLEAELTTQESLISQLGIILDSKASGGSGGGMEYKIVNLAEETTSIPFTLKRVTSTFGMMTTSGQGGMGVKNVAHYNLSGMSATYQGSVVSFLRPLSCENGALTSSTNFVAPYVAIFINDPSKEAIYEE